MPVRIPREAAITDDEVVFEPVARGRPHKNSEGGQLLKPQNAQVSDTTDDETIDAGMRKVHSFADAVDFFSGSSKAGRCCRYKAPMLVWFCIKAAIAGIYGACCAYSLVYAASSVALKKVGKCLCSLLQLLTGICILISVILQCVIFVVLYLCVSSGFKIDLDFYRIIDLIKHPWSPEPRARRRAKSELAHMKLGVLCTETMQHGVSTNEAEMATLQPGPQEKLLELISRSRKWSEYDSQCKGHWLIMWEPHDSAFESETNDDESSHTQPKNSIEAAMELHSLQVAHRVGKQQVSDKIYEKTMKNFSEKYNDEQHDDTICNCKERDTNCSGATLLSGDKALDARNWAPFTRTLYPRDRAYSLHTFDNGLKAITCTQYHYKEKHRGQKSGCLEVWDLVEGKQLTHRQHGVTALATFQEVPSTSDTDEKKCAKYSRSGPDDPRTQILRPCDRLITCSVIIEAESPKVQIDVWDLSVPVGADAEYESYGEKLRRMEPLLTNTGSVTIDGGFCPVQSVRVFDGGTKALLLPRVNDNGKNVKVPLYIVELKNNGRWSQLGEEGDWHTRKIETVSVCGNRAISCCTHKDSDPDHIKLWGLPTTSSCDGKAAHTGQCIGWLSGHSTEEGHVNFCSIFADGKRALSCSRDFTLKLWDLEEEPIEKQHRVRCLATLRGHTKRVHSCDVLGGQRGEAEALSCSDDGSLRLWDLLDTERASTVMKPAGEVAGIDRCALFPGSPQAVAGHKDGILRVWNLIDCQCMLTLRGHSGVHGGFCRLVCLDRGFSFASASYDGTVRVWNLAARERARTVSLRTVSDSTNKNNRKPEVTCLAPFNTGQSVLAGYSDGKLRKHNLVQQRPVAIYDHCEGCTSCVTCCAVSRNGKVLLSAADDGTVCMSTMEKSEEQHGDFKKILQLGDESMCSNISLFDDDKERFPRRALLSVTSRTRHKFEGLFVYDLKTHEDELFQLKDSQMALFQLKDSQMAFVADGGESTLLKRIEFHKYTPPFCVYQAGHDQRCWRVLLCSGGNDKPALQMWGLDHDQLHDDKSSETRCKFYKQITKEENQKLWKNPSDKPEQGHKLELLGHKQGHKQAVLSCTVFPGGRQAVSCSESEVIIWDLVELTELARTPGPTKYANLAAIACYVVPDPVHTQLAQYLQELGDMSWEKQQDLTWDEEYESHVESGEQGCDEEYERCKDMLNQVSKVVQFIRTCCIPSDSTGQIKRHLEYFDKEHPRTPSATSEDNSPAKSFWEAVLHLGREVAGLQFWSAQVLTCFADGTVRTGLIDSDAKALIDKPALRARYSGPDVSAKPPSYPVDPQGFKPTQVTCFTLAQDWQSDVLQSDVLQPVSVDMLQMCIGRYDGSIEVLDLSRIQSHASCARTVWQELDGMKAGMKAGMNVDDEREGRSWKEEILLPAVLHSPHVIYQRDRDSEPSNQTLVHKIARLREGGTVLSVVENRVQRQEKFNRGLGGDYISAVDGMIARAGTIHELDIRSCLEERRLGRYLRVVESIFTDRFSDSRLRDRVEQLTKKIQDQTQWNRLLEKHGVQPSKDDDVHRDKLRQFFDDVDWKRPQSRQATTGRSWLRNKTPLAVALTTRREECVQLLLENYLSFAKHDLKAPWSRLQLLPQAELALALKMFPDEGAAFLRRLELTPTHLASSYICCDLSGNECIVESHHSAFPMHPYKQLPWWNYRIQKIWKHSSTKNVDVRDQCHDSRWGEPVISLAVPLAGTVLGAEEAITFSQLLEAAIDHAKRERKPDIFNSDVLKMIVQQKWDGSCGHMFWTLCLGYALYIMIFTWVVLELQPHKTSSNQDHWSAWAGWWFAVLYTLLLINHERFQLSHQGFRSYFVENYWNHLDLVQQVVMLAALFLVYWRDRDMSDANMGRMPLWVQQILQCESSGCNAHINAVQGIALLCGWLKALYYLRGFESTASVVNTLCRIFEDMVPWMLVLTFVFIAFAGVFYQLLRLEFFLQGETSGSWGIESQIGNATGSTFADSPLEALVTVYSMMLGDFDHTIFKDSPFPVLSVGIFVLFMLIVAVVMFNAVIAIMGDTFARVKEEEEASSRLERAKLIVELEFLLKAAGVQQSMHCAQLSLQTLLSLPLKFHSLEYIHVLRQRGESKMRTVLAQEKIRTHKELQNRRKMQDGLKGLESKADKIHQDVTHVKTKHDESHSHLQTLVKAHARGRSNTQTDSEETDSEETLHLASSFVDFIAGVAAGIELPALVEGVDGVELPAAATEDVRKSLKAHVKEVFKDTFEGPSGLVLHSDGDHIHLPSNREKAAATAELNKCLNFKVDDEEDLLPVLNELVTYMRNPPQGTQIETEIVKLTWKAFAPRDMTNDEIEGYAEDLLEEMRDSDDVEELRESILKIYQENQQDRPEGE